MHTFEEVKAHRDVILKRSKTYPTLMVAKYHRRCFYDGRWDAVTKESRGHVWHESGKLVIAGPTKIMNYTELGTTIPRDEKVLIVRKVNGFLGCATFVPEVNDVVISTTGSLDSDFVKMAREKIPVSFDRFLKLNPYHTAFFEITHENDPHIIPEIMGAWLLGIRSDFTKDYSTSAEDQKSLDDISDEYGLLRPNWRDNQRFSDVVNGMGDCVHEGFVCYGENTVLKLKSPYYKFLKAVARKEDIVSLDMRRIDEEFFPLLDIIKTDWIPKHGFDKMAEQDRLEMMRDFLEKEY